MKTCFKCNGAFPLTEFYKNSSMADGYVNKCKPCTRSDIQINYRTNRAAKNLYERWRAKQPERGAKKIVYTRLHRQRYPEKYKARSAVAYALKHGRLTRQPCSSCGEVKSQAHHDDYSKPLDVRWLCFRCHREKAHGQTVSTF